MRHNNFIISRRWNNIGQVPIETFSVVLHHGGVCALSVAAWKPVFATCGKTDRTVKLWNYGNRSLLLTQHYAENVLNVSMHPIGLHVIVALVSAVEFSTVLYSDHTLMPQKRFDVAGSDLAQFSTSGHMFAVVDGFKILVYSSITFDRCHTLSGHENAVSDFFFYRYIYII